MKEYSFICSMYKMLFLVLTIFLLLNYFSWLFISILIFGKCFHLELAAGLRLVMLEVPSPSYAGESIELSCIYELEHDKLYSVKWFVYPFSLQFTSIIFLFCQTMFNDKINSNLSRYKNDVEFYR